jgi:WD40 repeat protein
VGGEPLVRLTEVATGRVRGDLTKAGDVTSSAYVTYNDHKVYPSVTFSPDGRVVVVDHLYGGFPREMRRIARVWQVEPLAELCTLDSCQELRFSPDGRNLVALTADGSVKLWPIRPEAGHNP